MAGDVRVHRQDEEAAFVVRRVELRAEHLLDQIRIGQAAVGCAAEVREVVEDALDRQLDDAARLLVDQDFVGVVARHQAAVVEEAGVLHLLHRPRAELPRRRAVADRLPAERLGQRGDRAIQHVLFGGRVVHAGEMLVDPAVHADLVAAAFLDRRNHVGVEQVTDRGNEERRGDLMLVEQTQDARQPVDRAVLAARDRLGDQVAGREIGRCVVDVEAQSDRDTRAVGPLRRLQPLAGADVKHLRAHLIERQLGPRLRPALGKQCGPGERNRQSAIHQQSAISNQPFLHASSTP